MFWRGSQYRLTRCLDVFGDGKFPYFHISPKFVYYSETPSGVIKSVQLFIKCCPRFGHKDVVLSLGTLDTGLPSGKLT